MGGSIDKNVLANLDLENPWQHFLDFCTERHSIYLKREAGVQRPWTSDTILHQCRFTNLFREFDKTSEFIFNWVVGLSFKDTIANLIYARLCNKPSTMLKTGHVHLTNPEEFITIIDSIGQGKTANKTNKKPVWRGAYQIAGSFKSKLGYETREELISNHIPIVIDDIVRVIDNNHNQIDMSIIIKQLNKVWGYNNNMVFTQVLLDIAHLYKVLPNQIEPPILSGVEPLLQLFKLEGKEMVRKAMAVWNENNSKQMYYKDAEHSLCEFRKYLCWTHDLSLKRYYKELK